MPLALPPLIRLQAVGVHGVIPGALLYTYSAGGPNTPKATFTDDTGVKANANPLVADGNGIFPSAWLDGFYFMAMADAQGNRLWTQDNVSSIMDQSNLVYASAYASDLGNLITSLGTGTNITLVIDQPMTLSGNVVIPPNILLVPTLNGIITGGVYSLTINSPFPNPGPFQIFAGFTAGNVVFGSGVLTGAPNPAWFGGGSAGVAMANASTNIIAVLTVNSTTPSVASFLPVYATANTTATTITSFANAVIGQSFIVQFGNGAVSPATANAFTTIHFGATILGNGGNDWTPDVGGSMYVTYDGTNFWAITSNVGAGSGSATPGTGSTNGVSGYFATNDATFPTVAVDISVAAATLTNPLNSEQVTLTDISLTVNLSTSGAVNVLDTGTLAEASWYYLWLISDGTTAYGLGSLSNSAPSLPTGYPYQQLLGVVRTASGAATLLNFTQTDGEWWYDEPQQVKTAATVQAWTVQACTTFIPPVSFLGIFSAQGTVSEASIQTISVKKNGSPSTKGHTLLKCYSQGSGTCRCATDASQNVQLNVSLAKTWAFNVEGFVIPF